MPPRFLRARLAYAWLRSRGFAIALGVGAVVAVVGAVATDVTLALPFLHRALPLSTLLVLVSALMVASPLQDRFGGLESTTIRARADRAVAGAVACGSGGLACLPAAQSAGGGFRWSMLLALLVIAVFAVVLLGSLAWLAPLVLGLTGIYVDLTYHDVISRALEAVGPHALFVLLGAALIIFVVRGPRSA